MKLCYCKCGCATCNTFACCSTSVSERKMAQIKFLLQLHFFQHSSIVISPAPPPHLRGSHCHTVVQGFLLWSLEGSGNVRAFAFDGKSDVVLVLNVELDKNSKICTSAYAAECLFVYSISSKPGLKPRLNQD